MNLKKLLVAAAIAGGIVVAPAAMAAAAVSVDPKLPDYKKVSGVSGNLSSVGSDTLNNLVTFWAEDYKKQYPNINIQIQGAGSSTAPPALTEGTANIGPMSRMMKDQEIQAFEKKFGYKPTGIPVAIDALAVFVHKDNPIKGLTMSQVDAIFSATRKCGGSANITRWGDAGMTGAWKARDLQLYGRNSVSGTYGYFKEHALCKGDFKPNVNEQPGSASVVQSVGASVNAIGYSGIGYSTSSVRALPLAGSTDDKFVAATAENAIKNLYPLSRFLYIYVNKAPNKALNPLEAEFFRLALSKQGQETVVKDGYIPMPARVAAKALKDLGL